MPRERQDERNRRILAEYNSKRYWGRVRDLAAKYAVHPSRIIHIVKATRRLIAREQYEARMKKK